MSKLSVVIPSEGKTALTACLEALTSQTETDFDVHVIDDSGDGVALAAARSYLTRLPLTVHQVVRAPQGAATARNVGLYHAKAQRVLFLDDDCLCAPDVVARHAAYAKALLGVIGLRRHVAVADHQRVSAQALAGRLAHAVLAYAPDRRAPARINELIAGCRARIYTYAWTCHLSYPVEPVRALGGFWQEMKGSGWEDCELALRAFRSGLRFTLLEAPVVYHLDHPQSALQRAHAPANKKLFFKTLAVAERTAYAQVSPLALVCT